MSWRSWSRLNPCPACHGQPWAGASSAQCRGGYNPELSDIRVWCGLKESGRPSASGTTWAHRLTEPYPWDPTDVRKPGGPKATDGFGLYSSPMPFDLRQEAGYRRTAHWDYFRPVPGKRDADYAYSVVRFDWDAAHGPLPKDSRPKDYRPGRADIAGRRSWRWGLPRDARIPYALPQVAHAIRMSLPLYICEGEKACDALNYHERYGDSLAATCNPCGSNSWGAMPDPLPWFDGVKQVHVIADRDEAGRRWARDVVETFRKALPPSRIAAWHSATISPGDDVVDHIAAGFDLSELELFELTP